MQSESALHVVQHGPGSLCVALLHQSVEGLTGLGKFKLLHAIGDVQHAFQRLGQGLTLKPLDTETILREAARPGRLVVVAENHSVIGSLGEAVVASIKSWL